MLCCSALVDNRICTTMQTAGEVITVEQAVKRCEDYEKEQMQHMYLFQTRYAIEPHLTSYLLWCLNAAGHTTDHIGHQEVRSRGIAAHCCRGV